MFDFQTLIKKYFTNAKVKNNIQLLLIFINIF